MPLYEIRVLFEADGVDEVDRLLKRLEGAVCPYPASEEHRCPNRWFFMTTELPDAEAAELDELLNE